MASGLGDDHFLRRADSTVRAMRWPRFGVVVAALIVALVPLALVAEPGSDATTAHRGIPLPTSMASTGDSITGAFDVGWCCLLSAPRNSWSTGTANALGSQYERLLAAQPRISGHADNFARVGAKMADLDAQLAAAAALHVQYVTVLIGANDLCTRSVGSMTPTSTFAAQFTSAVRHFTTADPGAHLFVSSIPDIYRLWSALHSNPRARLTWRLFSICPSVLGPHSTKVQRQQVQAQESADNAALATACTTRFAAVCRWDNYATFHVHFGTKSVSAVDFFHPSIAGQKALAATTWAAGYWPSLA
jgi:lysophospholipase L1-like esterase